jgi:hypothetical protein
MSCSPSRWRATGPRSAPTRIGGPGATDPLPLGAETPVWLAVSDDREALVSGRYFKRRRQLRANPAAYDEDLQRALLARCADLTGVTLPR